MLYQQPIGAAENAPYINANPAQGIEGSPVPAAAIEHPQREILNVIEKAGLVPDAANLEQLHQAILALIAQNVLCHRKTVTKPLNLFARANGNNNNDGLSVETAWKDPLEAIYYINNKIDLASSYVTLDVGAGTFDWDSAVAIAPLCSGAGGNMQADQTRYAVRIIGAGQDSTIFRDGIQVGPVSAYIKGVKAIPNTSRVTCAFEALRGANLTCEDVSCELNDTGNGFVRGFGATQAQLSIVGNTKVSGTRAYNLVHGSYQSTLTLTGAFAVMNSAMVVSADVMRSISNSYFLMRATCSGTCVGKKYAISSNGGIDSGGTYNTIPGTLAGTVDATTGGWLK